MTIELVATIAWSEEGRVTRADGACVPVLGRSALELPGLSLSEALGLPAARAVALESRMRAAGRGVEFIQVDRKDRAMRSTLRLEYSRTPEGLEAAVVDLSALLEGAPPVQISALSSSLSHEVRNPLSSVKMAVQTLARNGALSERDQRRLFIANREIRTMERMLWLLSEYGRDTPPQLELVPLRTVVQEAATLVQPELTERGVTVEVSEPADLPRARVDLNRLRPVLSQLLLNVAMGQPEASRVEVALGRGGDGDTVHLRVRDAAAALPPSDRATLFVPFGSRLARGAGLSLAALRRVMLSQDGDVTVEGGEHPGLVFTLLFAAE
ncbi:MAG: HAMP domain-containing histidine kinase [Myxococcaceae bacterium]|nr:HAMP domain-containing histidine kinase [Myxococcaceae bacterium]